VKTISPSVIAPTRPEISSGAPLTPIDGMSVLPPSGNVTFAPMPASTIFATACGSRIGAIATSSRPCRRISATTFITSWAPPEPQLSQ
jgi:hypothetical protein